MINFVKKSCFYFIDELKILKKNISWDSFVDYKSNANIHKTSIISSPYNLQNINLGRYSYIDRASFVSNAEIGGFCSIGPNFMAGHGIHPINGVSTSPMFYSTKKQNGTTFSKRDKIVERKPIKIGNDVFIGINVTILDGVKIGDGAVIGAGAVVSKDIPPYAIAAGNPIQIKKYRFTEQQITTLLEIKWWDFEDEKLKDVEKDFFDIDEFIRKYAV